MSIFEPKKALEELRNSIHRELLGIAGESKESLDKSLFLVSLATGTLAIALTTKANEEVTGRVAIGHSTLKGGLVEGYFWLAIPETSSNAPDVLHVLAQDGSLVKVVKIEYETKNPNGIARKILIQSVRQVSSHACEIDGSIKLDDGWHHFKFLYY